MSPSDLVGVNSGVLQIGLDNHDKNAQAKFVAPVDPLIQLGVCCEQWRLERGARIVWYEQLNERFNGYLLFQTSLYNIAVFAWKTMQYILVQVQIA